MRKVFILTCLLIVLAIVPIGCSGTSDTESGTSQQVTVTENTAADDVEIENRKNAEIEYKTEEIAGCKFLIPESATLKDSGDRRNTYVLDANNMVLASCGFGELNDWEKKMEAGVKVLEDEQNFKTSSTRFGTINDCPAYIVDGQINGFDALLYEINIDNKGMFTFLFFSSPGTFLEEQADVIVSSLDYSGFEEFRNAWYKQKNENAGSINTAEKADESGEQVAKEDNKTEDVDKPKENEARKSTLKPNNGGLTYDDDGYVIVTYSNRGRLANIDKPNVHLTGTLVDTNNSCFIIEDESGHHWTGESAGGQDFTEYIGTECDIYGFCTGGISKRHNTPLIDMAYKDSHISFEDGRSYYPKNYELSDEFPSWNFENKKEDSGTSVWIPTEGGTKYHSYEGCSGMENPEQVTEEEAISRGFDRCGKCW